MAAGKLQWAAVCGSEHAVLVKPRVSTVAMMEVGDGGGGGRRTEDRQE